MPLLQGLRWRPAPNSTVVDVGGGTGALLAHWLSGGPSLLGVLFDLPAVLAEVAAAVAQPEGGGPGAGSIVSGLVQQGRVQLVGGSFFEPASMPLGDVYVLRCVPCVNVREREHLQLACEPATCAC